MVALQCHLLAHRLPRNHPSLRPQHCCCPRHDQRDAQPLEMLQQLPRKQQRQNYQTLEHLHQPWSRWNAQQRLLLGKPAGQDAARGKAGFVALMGSDAAAAEAKRLIDEANNALAPWQGTGEYMQELATFAITRKT